MARDKDTVIECDRSAMVETLAVVPGGAVPSKSLSRNSIRLIYLDHRALTRDCIAGQLAGLLPEFEVQSFSNLLEIRHAQLPRQPGCIVCHTHSLCIDSERVVEVLTGLNDLFHGVAIIVMSDLDVLEDPAEAMRFGVMAYIPTSLPLKAAPEVVRLVYAGYSVTPAGAWTASARTTSSTNESALTSVEAAHMTPRQIEVLRELCQGKQNKTIAHELRMSEETVKCHIKEIMKKMRARNRMQVVLNMQRAAPDAPVLTNETIREG